MLRVKIPSVVTLIAFTLTSLNIFIDRGAVSGIPEVLRDTFDVNSAELGAIGSVFMLGYMLASPAAAHVAQFYHSLNVMLFGVCVWTGAVFLCGVVNNYWLFLTFRGITGVGEAFFFPLVPAYILHLASPKSASTWTGLFYSTVYLGTAAGYIYSSQVYNATGNWHWAFLILAIAMTPWICFYLISDRPSFDKTESEKGMSFRQQLVELLNNPSYCFYSLGSAGYTFTFGGLAFWGPDMVQHLYGVSEDIATLTLGAVVIVSGMLGTMTGAAFFDFLGRKYSKQLHAQQISERMYDLCKAELGCKLVLMYTSAGLAVGLLAVFMPSFWSFIGLFGLCLFCMCCGIGVSPIVTMLVVERKLRKQAIAMLLLINHLLGDFPSPFLIGLVLTWLSYKLGLLLTMLWLSFALLSWGLAYLSIVNST